MSRMSRVDEDYQPEPLHIEDRQLFQTLDDEPDDTGEDDRNCLNDIVGLDTYNDYY